MIRKHVAVGLRRVFSGGICAALGVSRRRDRPFVFPRSVGIPMRCKQFDVELQVHEDFGGFRHYQSEILSIVNFLDALPSDDVAQFKSLDSELVLAVYSIIQKFDQDVPINLRRIVSIFNRYDFLKLKSLEIQVFNALYHNNYSFLELNKQIESKFMPL